MEGTKLDIAAKEKEPLSPATAATYKQIPEDDTCEKSSRPQSVHKEEHNSHEPDGADEKMLMKEDTKVAPNSNIDLSQVKFTSSEKNGDAKDAKLDIGELKSEFVGLTKEELLKCANEPFWIRLRWFLFIAFWVLWAGMLIGAIMIIIAAPKCTPPQPKTWWEEGPITDVATLNHETLENVKAHYAGIVVDYPADAYVPLNATPEFETFLVGHKDHNIIVALNPTVSDAWFQSSEDKTGDFDDYYIWRSAGSGWDNTPNNWLSKASTDEERRSAWKYSEKRKQYYYAPDGKPQLNFRNEKVRAEFKNVLKGFIDAGADGFVLSNVPGLLVDSTYADESDKKTNNNYSMTNYHFYTHFKTENLPELQPIVREWRTLIKNKTASGVLMLSDELTTMEPYKFNGTLLIDLPKQRNAFNVKLDAPKLYDEVDSVYKNVGEWPVWNVTNTAYPMDAAAAVVYLLKGASIFKNDFQIAAELKEARHSQSVLHGTQNLYKIGNDTLFAYTRMYPGNPGYLVVFNPNSYRVVADLARGIQELPDDVTVQYMSSTYNETGITLIIKARAKEFPISAESAIVLSFVPKKLD